MIRENWKSAEAQATKSGGGAAADADVSHPKEGAKPAASSTSTASTSAGTTKELTEDERAVLALKEDMANDGLKGL